MVTTVHAREALQYDLGNDVEWIASYHKILSVARHFVYRYRIPCWYGQEEDLAEDVAQEAVRRMIERIQKAVRGEAVPIHSVEHMLVMIARNYILDLRRREYRVTRLSSHCATHAMEIRASDGESMTETATEHVYHEWLFLQLAREIARLPCKQRRAILIDLANRMSFNMEPTPLQAAFLSLEIDLRDYQQLLPENSVERARHASLVSLAYKRIANCSNL